jgi:hypothetical protein
MKARFMIELLMFWALMYLLIVLFFHSRSMQCRINSMWLSL